MGMHRHDWRIVHVVCYEVVSILHCITQLDNMVGTCWGCSMVVQVLVVDSKIMSTVPLLGQVTIFDLQVVTGLACTS